MVGAIFDIHLLARSGENPDWRPAIHSHWVTEWSKRRMRYSLHSYKARNMCAAMMGISTCVWWCEGLLTDGFKEASIFIPRRRSRPRIRLEANFGPWSLITRSSRIKSSKRDSGKALRGCFAVREYHTNHFRKAINHHYDGAVSATGKQSADELNRDNILVALFEYKGPVGLWGRLLVRFHFSHPRT